MSRKEHFLKYPCDMELHLAYKYCSWFPFNLDIPVILWFIFISSFFTEIFYIRIIIDVSLAYLMIVVYSHWTGMINFDEKTILTSNSLAVQQTIENLLMQIKNVIAVQTQSYRQLVFSTGKVFSGAFRLLVEFIFSGGTRLTSLYDIGTTKTWVIKFVFLSIMYKDLF